MAVLSGETINATVLTSKTAGQTKMYEPFTPRSKHFDTGTSFGLSMCGYDVRLDQDITIYPGLTTLASTYERFSLPLDVVAVMHDKSTWARVGVQVQNTVAEPGWEGWLTLELTFVPVIPVGASKWEVFWMRLLLATGFYPPIVLKKHTPIAQVLNHFTDKKTAGYANGKYQNQARGPQVAISS